MSRRIRGAWKATHEVVSETVAQASLDGVPMMAAAISYYLLLTIAPLALAMAVLAGAIRSAAGLAQVAGEATPLPEVLGRYSSGSSGLAGAVALGILLFGASGVFGQFALAITRIWKEPAQRGPIFAFARRHAIAFLLLLVLAVGLLASLVVGSAVSAITAQFAEMARSVGVDIGTLEALEGGRLSYDFVAAFLLFTAAFSLVPLRKIRARDVAPGAAITAGAYAVGQVGLSAYLANSSRMDLYGGFSGLIAVMLWAYYSSMIALYGAELTKALVLRRERVDAQS